MTSEVVDLESNDVQPLLNNNVSGDDDEFHDTINLDDYNDDEEGGGHDPIGDTSNVGIDGGDGPRLRIVVNPYSDMEWLGLGLGVFAFFYIVPYIVLNIMNLSLRAMFFIYYPLGIGYILILHQSLDQNNAKFRNHKFIKFIDNKDYYCIAYLVSLLAIYAVDHRTHGHILNWISNIFGSGVLYYPWNITLFLVVVSFMALSSASVVLLASRKTYVTLKLVRTMQPGRERSLVLIKGGLILALSVALLTLSREKFEEGEYEGPPFGSVFYGTCELCLIVSSVAAIFAAVKYIRSNDWTMPESIQSAVVQSQEAAHSAAE